MNKIIIPYYSKSGHTKRLAEAVLSGVRDITDQSFILNIEQTGDPEWTLLEEADGIIFGTPTYMGSVAGPYKVFLEETAYRGFWTGQKFADKMAGGFTIATYPSGDKLGTLMQLSIFAAQHGMIWVNNKGTGAKVTGRAEDYNHCGAWLGLMANSSPDKSKLISDDDFQFAGMFGKRFANAVKRWNRDV